MAITHIDVSGWTEEQWLFHRYNGVGASELGILLGVNDYQCALQLFHNKIGKLKHRPKNKRMNIGLISESLIADLWEYYEKDGDTFNNNMNLKRKVRKAEEVKSYIYNDEYPDIFVSLDYEFSDSRFRTKCPLELKNKTFGSYNKYQNKQNPSESIQLAAQLLIPEREYGEIANFIDNVDMEVFPLLYEDAKIAKNAILNVSGKFWKNVLQARKYINQIEHAKLNYNMKLVAELEMEILTLEPEPENTNAYLDYLTDLEVEKRTTIPIQANVDMIEKANKLRKAVLKKKKINEEITELKCYFANIMHKEKRNQISFGKLGDIKMYNNRFLTQLK